MLFWEACCGIPDCFLLLSMSFRSVYCVFIWPVSFVHDAAWLFSTASQSSPLVCLRAWATVTGVPVGKVGIVLSFGGVLCEEMSEYVFRAWLSLEVEISIFGWLIFHNLPGAATIDPNKGNPNADSLVQREYS